jgi:predicted nucleotide-binding protein (sugar kinase/HSP70/actin superfamily)
VRALRKKEQKKPPTTTTAIVTSYPENIKNNMPEIKENGVNFMMPFLPWIASRRSHAGG